MRHDIMGTYNELMNVKNPKSGLPIYFEYVSKYRRILVLLYGATWILRVSYKGSAAELKQWEKTYGDKQLCYQWALASMNNREINLGILTIKEAVGNIGIDKCKTQ